MAVAVLAVERVVEAAVYLVMAATAMGVSSVEVAGTGVLVIVAAPQVVPDLAGHQPELETAEVAVPVVVLRIPTEVAVRAMTAFSRDNEAVVLFVIMADVAMVLIDTRAFIAASGTIANPIAVAIQMVASRLQPVAATPKANPESQLGTQ